MNPENAKNQVCRLFKQVYEGKKLMSRQESLKNDILIFIKQIRKLNVNQHASILTKVHCLLIGSKIFHS